MGVGGGRLGCRCVGLGFFFRADGGRRGVVRCLGVSRVVQPDLRAAVRITRDTCYADSPGDLTAIRN